MRVDFGVMFKDAHAEIGVPATFTASGGSVIDITVIDDTRPKTLPAGTADVADVAPGAYARIPELTANGITRDGWLDAAIAFNGRTWVVRSYELRGSPNGEDQGEVRFLLKANG